MLNYTFVSSNFLSRGHFFYSLPIVLKFLFDFGDRGCCRDGHTATEFLLFSLRDLNYVLLLVTQILISVDCLLIIL